MPWYYNYCCWNSCPIVLLKKNLLQYKASCKITRHFPTKKENLSFPLRHRSGGWLCLPLHKENAFHVVYLVFLSTSFFAPATLGSFHSLRSKSSCLRPLKILLIVWSFPFHLADFSLPFRSQLQPRLLAIHSYRASDACIHLPHVSCLLFTPVSLGLGPCLTHLPPDSYAITCHELC